MENTVVNKMIQDCRIGMDKRRPVIWIKTSEMELVRRIVKSEQLVPNLRNTFKNGWAPLFEAENDRLIWGELSGNHNIKFASVEELKKYFNTSSIKELSEIKNPPHLFIVKAEGLNNDEVSLSFWQEIIPFIDAYVSDTDEYTPLSRSAIILFSERASIPADYVPYCHIVDEPYPSKTELLDLLNNKLGNIERYNAKYRDVLANEMVGLSLIRAEQTTAYIQRLFGDSYSRERCDRNGVTAERIIIDERAQELKRSELLTLIEVEDSEIAGIETFEKWMEEQALYLNQSKNIDSEFKVKAPKGVLLCGIPGTGKSAMAKKFAYTTGMKLLRMDIGKLMGSYVGESEHNMEKALKIVDATAPCVLFIDELDKSFEGAKSGSGNNSSDTTLRRMFATLLTWMQDHKSACFVFATANDISALPKEFFRSGRFDCMFSLFMPTFDECVKIFEYHIKKRIGDKEQPNGLKKPYIDFTAIDLAKNFMNVLQANNRFVTGADIEKLVELTFRRTYKERNEEHTTYFEDKFRIQARELEKIFKVVVEGQQDSKNQTREIASSVYGDSKEQLDSIALCYIRLLRNNFVPVSSKQLLYDYKAVRKQKDSKENPQSVGDGWPEFEVTVEMAENISPYDEKLAAKLKDLIKFYGPKYEQEMLKKMF